MVEDLLGVMLVLDLDIVSCCPDPSDQRPPHAAGIHTWLGQLTLESSPWKVAGSAVSAPGFTSPSLELVSWSPGAKLLGCLSILS